MSLGPIERGRPEYLALLEERHLYKIFGAEYKNVKRAEEMLERLEKVAASGAAPTHKDWCDFLTLDELLYQIAIKAGFDPSQPRNPAGGSDGGQWTDAGGGGASASPRMLRPTPRPTRSRKPNPHANRPYYDPETGIYDPPPKPVYPVENLIAAIYGGRAFSLAMSVIRNEPSRSASYNRERQTDHGDQRVGERVITDKDIDAAIDSARNTGNISTKKGKYGTPQYHYHGSNGLTVIVETKGRNAGKIITMYGEKPGGKLK